MPRNQRQIDEDARVAADVIRAGNRPMRAPELAEALRKQGRAQSEKQAQVTAARGEQLGLLCKRGRGAWDCAETSNAISRSAPTVNLFVECAKRLLGMPHSVANSTAARVLLEIATTSEPARAWPEQAAKTGTQHAHVTNGAAPNGRREIEVLEPPH